jgi:murein DD-endopeptidase MepM/ murein hydrolase activator NlpD
VIERHRHATVGRVRRRHTGAEYSHAMTQPRVARRRGGLRDLYSADTAEARSGGRFRWFFSTCLAAAVGSVAIVAALFGASDPNDGRSGGGMSRLRTTISSSVQIQPPAPAPVAPDGLAWATPKSDRLEATTGAMVTRYIVQDSIRQRRGSREYIQNKPYARVLARLVAVRADAVSAIPAFNPIRLYGNTTPIGESDESPVASGINPNGVAQRVVELLGSILPTEDGQELDAGEVSDLVERARASAREALTMRPGFLPEGVKEPEIAKPAAAAEPLPTNTTVLEKTGGEQEDAAEFEGRQTRSHKVGRGDTLSRILQQAGADRELARGMVEAARGTFSERELSTGFVVDLTLEPSLANPDQLEPIRYAVYDDRGNHRVSVERGPAGEFVASASALDGGRRVTQTRDSERSAAVSLYAGVYQAALSQGVDPDVILQILRLHAHETDFRRRVRVADELELFFDLRDEGRGEEQLGELLYSAITAAGETQRYFRFKAGDGTIDYYDEDGNNSRKFLIRRPIRGDDARLTSGYGVRLHPLLNTRKLHTGVDWAAPIGTPIMASGNGVIEEAKFKGQNGNYIRIRHPNGYQSAYSHLSKFAAGVAPGVKVRQSQIIGYSGNTGFSTGPHLHYEVLVNNQFVDPMSIQVPRERRLTGRQLTEFQKERARIEDLLRRQPVRVEQISGR